MSLYTKTIAEAVPGRTTEEYEQIEDIMRHDIFHSTLDWQTSKQLKDGARLAAQILDSLESKDQSASVPDTLLVAQSSMLIRGRCFKTEE